MPFFLIAMSETIDDYKPLFLNWLKELEKEADQKGKKIANVYRRGLVYMRAYEGRLFSKTALRQVQFIGPKTADLLIDKLRSHCEEKNMDFPSSFGGSLKGEDEAGEETLLVQALEKDSDTTNTNTRKRAVSGALALEVSAKRKKSTRKYIPKHRSGSYAILIAMLLHRAEVRGMLKNEICTSASEYCDSTFTGNPASGAFFSAWQGIVTLLKNDLVYKHGRSPCRYYLTDEGKELALRLAQSSNITVNEQTDFQDISFDNNIRLSSECQPLNEISYSLPFNSREPEDYRKSRYDLNRSELSHDRPGCTLNGVKYEVWEPSEYDILLVVDNREVRSQLDRDFFPTRLKELGVPVVVETLSVGDALWVAQHKETKKKVVLDCIAERKRVDDLASSIRDGRFTEQKTRLKKAAVLNIYYIVEEAQVDIQEMSEAIQTAISSTITDSRFHLTRTRGADDTVQFFVTMTEVIKKYYYGNRIRLVAMKPINCDVQVEFAALKNLFSQEFSNRTHKYQCCHLFHIFQATLSKSEFLTVKDMFIQMLMTIRGLSLDKAIAIQQHFRTPRALIEFFKFEHAVTQATKKKDLIYEIFKDQVNTKKIGRQLLERIYLVWGN